jgi:hypothetical protein
LSLLFLFTSSSFSIFFLPYKIWKHNSQNYCHTARSNYTMTEIQKNGCFNNLKMSHSIKKWKRNHKHFGHWLLIVLQLLNDNITVLITKYLVNTMAKLLALLLHIWAV